MKETQRWRGALVGVVTGLTGLAVALAVSALMRQRVNPVQSVSELVRDLTPGPVAHKLIELVGELDKPLLISGVTLAMLALSAWAGVIALKHLAVGTLMFLAMGAVAGVAAVTAHAASTYSVVPVLVGAVAWVVTLSYLRPLPAREVIAEDRRGFLIKVGGVAAAAAVIGAGGRFFGKARRAVEQTRARLRLPVTEGVVPPGSQLDVKDLGTWRVANDSFYRIDTALVVPTIQPKDWRLRIHGKVDRELSFTYDDLLARQLTEAWVTICCVSNEVGGDLIGNAWWSGVRIAELLAEAGLQPGADAVLQTSDDGWTCGTPISALTDDRNAMLAVAMNGRPLPLEHGFPVRMVVPGLYGFVSATKWLVDLEVTSFDKFEAYWTPRGWSEQAPVKTQSRIEVPRGGRAMAGEVEVAGTAWAQHTGIERVEVRVDGEAWVECELGRVPHDDTWVQWRTSVQVDAGIHTLAVRATDKSGYTQTAAKTDVAPDGATGWHTIRFTADG